MHLFKKYLNFSNKINFYKLAIDLENGLYLPCNIVNSLDCPRRTAVLDWWEFSQKFKDISILVKFYLLSLL